MQKVTAILFVFLLIAGGVLNAWNQFPRLRLGLSRLRAPNSASEFLAKFPEVGSLLLYRIINKPDFTDVFGYVQLALGKREINNFTIVRGLDGSLNHGNIYPVDITPLRDHAAYLGRLKDTVEAAGGQLIFLSPPDRVVKGVTRISRGVPFLDLNMAQDAFLDLLREYGVHYLDARTSLLDNDLDPKDWIFKTDFHWTSAASFEAFRDLLSEMERLFGAKLDPDGKYRDPTNYNFRTYPQVFRGNLGESTGVVFGGCDDFTAIWPAFATEYEVEMVDPNLGLQLKQGKAEETIYDASKLERPKDATRYYHPYNFYFSGNKSWAKVANMSNPNKPSLLLVHDPYGIPLASFLAPIFGEMHTIRFDADDFQVDIEPYLNDHKFDYVVVELMPYNYITEVPQNSD